MADPISEQCFDIALGLYACSDSTIEDCGKIRRLVAGLENELLAARAEVERLRAEYDGVPTYNAVCQQMHDTEQELAAAKAEAERVRAEVERLRNQVAHPPMQLVDIAAVPNLRGILDDLKLLDDFRKTNLDDLKLLDDCRKTNARLGEQIYANERRAWEALGKPEGTHDTTNVQRLCAEVERLRAIMALTATAKVARHKETNQ